MATIISKFITQAGTVSMAGWVSVDQAGIKIRKNNNLEIFPENTIFPYFNRLVQCSSGTQSSISGLPMFPHSSTGLIWSTTKPGCYRGRSWPVLSEIKIKHRNIVFF